MPIFAVYPFRQQVGNMDTMGQAMSIHGNGSHKIQVEQGQIHEVVPGQGFILEMGMDTAKTF